MKLANSLLESHDTHTRKLRPKAGFPLDEFVRANREKSNLIGWRQTLTSSLANHIRFLLVRANKFAKWKTGLRVFGEATFSFITTGFVDVIGRDERCRPRKNVDSRGKNR